MKTKRLGIVLLLITCLIGTMIPMTAQAKRPAVGEIAIMLDAGHYAKYNKGAHPDYWESKQMWKLTNYLAEELEEYPGFVVGKTRTNQEKDMSLSERGAKSKGYDLFISMHSNSGGSKTTYPLAIVSSGKALKNKALPIAQRLAGTVKDTMKVNSDYAIWVRKQSDGRDWYGVIRSAASVGTPGIILEHSFHSNYTIAKWLLSDSNLRRMAQNEAKTIADYYGLTKDGDFAAPSAPEEFKAAGAGANAIKLTWLETMATSGYEIYRATSENGDYNKIDTIDNRGTASYTDSNVEYDKTYYYKVRGYRSINDETKYSDYTNVSSSKAKLGKPGGFDAYGYTYNTSKVLWKSVSGASNYEIYRADSKGGSYKMIESVSSKTTSYIDKELDTGRDYYYKVRATKKIGTSTKKGDYTTPNPAKPVPAAPSVKLSSSTNKIRVIWNPVEGADGYLIYRGASKSDDHELIVNVPPTEKDYLNLELDRKNKYSYKVRAYKNVEGRDVMGRCCSPVEKYTK